MKHTRPSRVGSVAAIVLLNLGPSGMFAQSIYQRPVTAQAIIDGSHGRYDGTFSRSAPAMICGETPKDLSFSGRATFDVQFPDSTALGPITSIVFGSNQLVGGVTKTSSFRLAITVMTAKGGRPPAYVLNTDPPGTKNTGIATLTTKGTVITLTVVGQNESGESIDLTVTCG